MRIKKCVVCNEYTLKEQHCGKQTIIAHPPKFNRDINLSKYRVGDC